jgi:hypothetical protein
VRPAPVVTASMASLHPTIKIQWLATLALPRSHIMRYNGRNGSRKTTVDRLAPT